MYCITSRTSRKGLSDCRQRHPQACNSLLYTQVPVLASVGPLQTNWSEHTRNTRSHAWGTAFTRLRITVSSALISPAPLPPVVHVICCRR